MTREQAEQIARKHHLQVFNDKYASIAKWVIDAIMEAVAIEREECADECYARHANGRFKHDTRDDCFEAIRARGNE